MLELIPAAARVLTVGDGDFVFTEGLAKARRKSTGELDLEIVASNLDSEEELVALYGELRARFERLRADGVEVVCGVDAAKLGDEGHLQGVAPFDRIVFNFPLIAMKAHAKGTRTADVHVSNRLMLVKFLQRAEKLLKPDGMIIVASKECYPYSWWRLEALPQWAGGKLLLRGVVPWTLTEYPSIYSGPCNVNKDAAVKATEAVIYVFAFEDSADDQGIEKLGGRLRKQGVRSLNGPVDSSRALFDCEICRVYEIRSEKDLLAHRGSSMHKKRLTLEARWEEVFAKDPAATGWLEKRSRQSPEVTGPAAAGDAAPAQPSSDSLCCSGLAAAKKSLEGWLGGDKTPDAAGEDGVASPRTPNKKKQRQTAD
eukprot:TRINITY_DN100527_c0_g1_i1.p1 TRINITY_DN100527_c0_g1~~TRINITY_DN100527_c0_g1_i1.p1  ORF type:complete len:369 (-),score=87.61 TRINITY_DN100527_c0_g1_i1:8-1114(-)